MSVAGWLKRKGWNADMKYSVWFDDEDLIGVYDTLAEARAVVQEWAEKRNVDLSITRPLTADEIKSLYK